MLPGRVRRELRCDAFSRQREDAQNVLVCRGRRVVEIHEGVSEPVIGHELVDDEPGGLHRGVVMVVLARIRDRGVLQGAEQAPRVVLDVVRAIPVVAFVPVRRIGEKLLRRLDDVQIDLRRGRAVPVASENAVRLVLLALTGLRYYIYRMLILLLRTIISALRSHRALALENLALRHQLEILKRNAKRPCLKNRDRTLWIILSHFWSDWRKSLMVVQPETVIRWHKRGFRLYWKWKSRPGWPGRRKVPEEIRDLIRTMSRANCLWGAPRIHGELLKLGIEVSQATVSKYMVRHRKPPSQSWRTFLKNHATDIVSVDFFTVPTATFRVLFVFLILSNERRTVVHFNVTESPTAAWTGQQIVNAFPWDTAPKYLLCDRDGKYGAEFIHRVENLGIEQVFISARSPWQNPYVERLIGSIRRECLDHTIIFNDRHLRRVLKEYFHYYHESRTHLGLEKDCPHPRPVESAHSGKIQAEPMVGGLHHRYYRQAA
jgi:putative transposase